MGVILAGGFIALFGVFLGAAIVLATQKKEE